MLEVVVFASVLSTSTLATELCETQHRIRWPRSGPRAEPAWSNAECLELAHEFEEAGRAVGLDPLFLVSFAVNESDLRTGVHRVSTSHVKGRLRRALDLGLMGLRCVLGEEGKLAGRCINPPLRGLRPSEAARPSTNIRRAAEILAGLKAGVPLLVTRREGDRLVRDVQLCKHRNHPYWAHYNWGTRVIERGRPRHYPHRVAVLYWALGRSLGRSTPELEGARFVQDRGKRPRQVDRPVGARQKRLVEQILASTVR
jgi:hypothetical protein